MSNNGDDHALADVTNRVGNVQVNEDVAKRVREAHWAEPQKYDYETYNAASNTQRTAPAAEEGTAEEMPSWAANAIKYEWSDEYGDVGPEHKELERMLFGDEHKMERGTEFSK